VDLWFELLTTVRNYITGVPQQLALNPSEV